MASSAYILVSFNEAIKADSCALVAPKLVVTVAGQAVTPESVTTTDPRYPGQILIKLPNDKVPKVGELVQVTFTPDETCNVVRRDNELPNPTPDAMTFNYNTSSNPNIIEGTQLSQKPQIVSVDVPDPSGGKNIVVTFTPGRDICGNLIDGEAGSMNQWTISVTQDPSGTKPAPSWDSVGYKKIGLNKLLFTTMPASGEPGQIQQGATVTIAYDGTVVAQGGAPYTIRDQFDLSMVNVPTRGVTNSVRNPVFYKATVETENPFKITAIFKKPDEWQAHLAANPPGASFFVPGTPVDMSNNSAGSSWPITGGTDKFKIWTESWAGEANKFIDISRVETVNTQWNDNGVLRDISAVQFTLDSFPIPSNENINLYWKSTGFTPALSLKRMRDKYGNEVWNSEWDPLVGKTPEGITSTMDVSSVYIYNNIEPLEVKSGSSLVVKNTTTNGQSITWDPSFSALLFFKRGTTDISVNDPNNISNASDFSFWNSTVNTQLSGSIKSVDGYNLISGSDPSRVEVWIDYDEEDFSKVINNGDVIKFFYTPGGAPHTEEAPWPTGIEDQYGNPLVGTLAGDPNSQGLPVTNNIYDGSGQLTYAKVEGIGNNLQKIYLTYDYDICGNTVDATGFSVRITQPEGGEPVAITGATANGNTGVILQLDNNVLAGATGDVLFDNTTSNIRNKYGLKLKNEEFAITNLANGPGQSSLYTFTKYPATETMIGKYDDINLLLDPSLNMEVLGHKKTGFAYKVEYFAKYPGGNLNSNLSTSDWVTVDPANVSISSGGDVITFNTGFNTGVGIRGFSKRHTNSAIGNSIKIKYTKPIVGGLLGDSGYLQSFPEQSMADSSNNILVPTINLTTALQQQPRDISNILVFNELPNRVYMRIEQPDLSGGTSDTVANRYYWDLSSVEITGADKTSFLLEYSGNSVGISSVGVHNSDADWPLDSNQNPIIPSVLDGTSARNSKWVVLNSSKDFQPTVGGDPSMNAFDLSYIHQEVGGITSGIMDQNGGMLANFNTADISSNVKWGDIVFETANVPYIPDTSNNEIWFGATPGSSEGFIFNEGTSASDFMYFPVAGAPFAPKSFSYYPQDVPLFDASMVLIFKDGYGNPLPIVTSGSDTAGKISYTKPPGRNGLRIGDTQGAAGQFNSTSYWVNDFSGVQVTNLYQGGVTSTYNFHSGVWYSVYDAGTNKMAADLSWNENIDGLNFNDISNNSNFLNQFILESEDLAVKVISLSGKTVRPVWNNDQSHAADQEVSYTKNASTTYNLQKSATEFAAEITDQLIPRRFDQPWFGFDLAGSTYKQDGPNTVITLSWAQSIATPAGSMSDIAFKEQFNALPDPSGNFNGGTPGSVILNNGDIHLYYMANAPLTTYSGTLGVTYTPADPDGAQSYHLKNSGGDYAIQLISSLPTRKTFALHSGTWEVMRKQGNKLVLLTIDWDDQINNVTGSTGDAAFKNQFNIDSVGGFSGGVMSQFNSFGAANDLSGQWQAAPTFPNPYSGNLSLDYTKDVSGVYNLKSNSADYAAELTNQAISSDVSGTWVDLSGMSPGAAGGCRWYLGQGGSQLNMLIAWTEAVTTATGGVSNVNVADFKNQFIATAVNGFTGGTPNYAEIFDFGSNNGYLVLQWPFGDVPTGSPSINLQYLKGTVAGYNVQTVASPGNEAIQFSSEPIPQGTEV